MATEVTMAATSYKLFQLVISLSRRGSCCKKIVSHRHSLWAYKEHSPTANRYSSWDKFSTRGPETSDANISGRIERKGGDSNGLIDGKAHEDNIKIVVDESSESDSDIGSDNSTSVDSGPSKAIDKEDGSSELSSSEKASDRKETTKKKKSPVSDMVKVIRHKKMLEIHQARRPKSRSRSVPAIEADPGFKNQLQEYISRHGDRLESKHEYGPEFAASKTGKVLMFPLSRSGNSFDEGHVTSIPDKSGEKLPSVTSILNVTRPMQQAMALLRWEKKMIKELGVDGFLQMKNEMFGEGHEIHHAIHRHLEGSPASDQKLSPGVQGYWRSCSEVLGRITDPTGFEIRVTHPAMRYTGFVDCVAEVNGKVSLFEWKTSRKLKENLSDNENYPLQTVAYLGAMNFDPSHHDIQVEQIVIVVMYKDGHPATVHYLNEETSNFYWTKWLGRLLEYHEIAEMKKEFIRGKITEWSKTKKATTGEENGVVRPDW